MHELRVDQCSSPVGYDWSTTMIQTPRFEADIAGETVYVSFIDSRGQWSHKRFLRVTAPPCLFGEY
jgi:hypothetical protein